METLSPVCPLLAKHSIDCVSVGVDRMQDDFEQAFAEPGRRLRNIWLGQLGNTITEINFGDIFAPRHILGRLF